MTRGKKTTLRNLHARKLIPPFKNLQVVKQVNETSVT